MEMLCTDIFKDESRVVDVKESFKDSKEKLEDLIREFDEKIRTQFSGAYTISITSEYLTADSISYQFANGVEKSSCFAVDFHTPTIKIEDKILISKLSFND